MRTPAALLIHNIELSAEYQERGIGTPVLTALLRRAEGAKGTVFTQVLQHKLCAKRRYAALECPVTEGTESTSMME